VLGTEVTHADMATGYADYFPQFIQKGVDNELFDLERLGQALLPERDLQFTYLGLQTLYDRYFIHSNNTRIELPQIFFMRVAMGLAAEEQDKNARAIEFYELLSSFDYMSSTPTLFNAGTLRPQLSSCYLTTVPDNLYGIYGAIRDNAMLSKFAGGLGNDWTPVRALGAYIKGTNGKSQGVVPFLKVVNDTAVAVNQGGKRKGAVCAYLETWHLDIEEFVELRKNTGDDRRRTHDMNTANWIPDLFMKRVFDGGEWTLFSPSDVPDLHDLYGKAFEERYEHYEELARSGKHKLFKTVKAENLWRKMLSMLFETGHPWMTFKDPCNLRSPQQHVGVVHSSNLCTEITLNTDKDEIAVCNLGSVNLPQHIDENGRLDREAASAPCAPRCACWITSSTSTTTRCRRREASNLRHRPVGLGIMGFQDALYAAPGLRLARGRGVCRPVHGSHVLLRDTGIERAGCRARRVTPATRARCGDQGIFPLDTLNLLAEARGGYVETDRSATLDWDALRNKIAQDGMRNSNCVAIAPTATISNIIGVDASIEPSFGNLSVKSNLSGEFTVVNSYLVRDLKRLGLWDDVMVMDLKHFDGSLRAIDRVPHDIKALYATAFEIETQWLVEAAARRQKWIDQAQSLNIYMAGASGKKLDDTYKLAWLRGLKTTYYLRTMAATHAEKSTGRSGQMNAVSNDTQTAPSGTAMAAQATVDAATDIKFCAIDDPGCEACQ
jgi:ribonucleoside-diphosphate reductase alpha chain